MLEQGEALARLQELYESYIAKVDFLEKNRKPGEGLLGLKGGPDEDPCHDRFADDLQEFYTEITMGKPASGTVRELMEYACTAPGQHREPRTAYWMLIAVQSLTQPLIRLLTPQDAGALAELYENNYRRFERLPSQKQLMKALKSAASQ